MAVIGKIRENTLFVLIFIGLGIGLFILMDIMSSNNRGGGAGVLKMGEIGETEINRQDFENTLSAVYSGGDAYANRDALWNFYVNEAMLRQEARAIGLGVSSQEMTDLQFGPNPSPVVRRNFANPQTGQINRELLTNIQNYLNDDNIQGGIDAGQLSPNFRPIWSYQSREVIAQRLQEKLNGLVSKAMYAPSWMAQENADNQVRNISAAVVKVPFDEILSSDISVADADIQAYLEDNRSLYFNKVENRVLSFVSFDVVSTPEDSAAIRNRVEEIKEDWSNSREDSIFAVSNNGSFANVFYGRNALPINLADRLLGTEMEVGAIYGPYLEGNAYKLVKLVDREVVADSVNTRHILISATTPEQFDAAEAKVDSLKRAIERGSSFSTLAETFSQDPGSKDDGGLYEGVTPGQFVKPFDDVIFRTGERGKLYSVRSQFGVHLVELLKRSSTSSPRVKVGYIVEPIVPSSETEDKQLERAQLFLSENNKLAKVKSAVANGTGLTVRQTAPLTINSFQVPEMGNNGSEIRDILCWAFSADAGGVSDRVFTFTDPQLFYENKHVVVAVNEVIPSGLATVASVREALTPVVANRLKGAQLVEQMRGKDLVAVANSFSTSIDTISNINLSITTLPKGLGREPRVVAAIFGTAAQATSAPVIGETGVFMVKPLSAPNTTASGSLPTTRQIMNQTQRQQVTAQLLTGMRANLEVDDQRADLDCR